MPVQTRAQKKAAKVSKKDEETYEKKEEYENQQAALVLLKLKKDNADLWNSLKADEELAKKKAELEKLREIKRMTDEYNMVRMIIRTHTDKADSLEAKITTLMSSVDK